MMAPHRASLGLALDLLVHAFMVALLSVQVLARPSGHHLASGFARMELPQVHHNAQLETRDGRGRNLSLVNLCPAPIWPAIVTQAGSASTSGFRLDPQERRSMAIDEHWNGRIWPRTNCSFNADGTSATNKFGNGEACDTGDCKGLLECGPISGLTPVTLFELQIAGDNIVDYADISLVDGGSVSMGFQWLGSLSGNPNLMSIPDGVFSPMCVLNPSLIGGTPSPGPFKPDSGFDVPYIQNSRERVANWCPSEYLVNRPQGPPDGVQSYPDGSIQRPWFSPFRSECQIHKSPMNCCTGDYDNPNCPRNAWSKLAKTICPDAYSYGKCSSYQSCPVDKALITKCSQR
jgi:hypothetical protein